MTTLAAEPRSKPAPDPETCWALLERVAASTQLRRAARLRELLLYIGRRSLKDHCERIHEAEIGTAVFERPADYDTSVDTIVRVNATELRKRIQAYFESEGSLEKVVLEIPRGNYSPVFSYRPLESPIQTNQSATAVASMSDLPGAVSMASETSGRHSRILVERIVAGLTIALLAVGCLYLWSQYRALDRSMYAWHDEPSVAALWGEILNSGHETDIVLADASFGLLQEITRRSFSFDDYLNHSYLNQIQSEKSSPGMQDALDRIALWNLGDQDDFKLARRILALDPLGEKIHMYNARAYLSDLTKRDNVILIGARISNPWDDLFENRMNFTVRLESNRNISVLNREPSAGEQQIYQQSGSAQYCVAAYLPNPNHSGVILVIEGTDAEATEAAGDFLLSEEQLSGFERRLRVSKLPYFEVLLKVTSVPGTPLTATVQAYRTYPNLY